MKNQKIRPHIKALLDDIEINPASWTSRYGWPWYEILKDRDRDADRIRFVTNLFFRCELLWSHSEDYYKLSRAEGRLLKARIKSHMQWTRAEIELGLKERVVKFIQSRQL